MSDLAAAMHDFEESGGHSPWEALGLNYAGYSSEQDRQAIAIMECIGDGMFCNDIARKLGLSPDHVELWQYIFCSADWCEYGTSPRGCWPIDKERWASEIENWRRYQEVAWSA